MIDFDLRRKILQAGYLAEGKEPLGFWSNRHDDSIFLVVFEGDHGIVVHADHGCIDQQYDGEELENAIALTGGTFYDG